MTELSSKLTALDKWLTDSKAAKAQAQKALKMEQDRKKEKALFQERLKKSRAIVQIVAKMTQATLEYHISNMVTAALAAVYEDAEEFQLEFKEYRNRTECWPWFVSPATGHKRRPSFSSGGGALDIASFALRCAIWSIKKTRPCLILDEPFKYVSIGLQDKCSEMVKRLTEKLNLQVIMVSHLPKINVAADHNIHIEKIGRISQCSTKSLEKQSPGQQK